MSPSNSRENIILGFLLPPALAAVAWAVYHLPAHSMKWQLGALMVVTFLLGSFLRIQLPRTKIHVTPSDAAVVLSFLLYGREVAVLLAVLEALATSLGVRRRGEVIRSKSIVANLLIAAVTVFLATTLVQGIFDRSPSDLSNDDTTRFVWLLATLAFSLFVFNSVMVATFIAAKNTAQSIFNAWSDYCLNALVIYLTSSILAGFTFEAIEQFNLLLFIAVGAFCSVIYVTYRGYVNDIRKTAAKAEQSERDRAEQAEVHVKELQHYIRKLEQKGDELKDSHERLQHAAFHDGLTGLPNRNYFIDAIRILLKDCKSLEGRPFALLYLDLNRFKTINDSVGHTRGDRLIKNVASRLRETVGENATIGRFSGDEFAILLRDIKTERDVINIACKVADALAQPFSLFGREVYTSVCVGIAFGSRSYKRAENILRDADIAMYHAKDSNQKYVVFDEQMHAKAVNLLQLETDLRGAIERNEFEVFYQPIVDLSNLRLGGFEALIRWNHPGKGMIAPSEFIGISEATDLIVPLTINVLENSCSQVRKWHTTDAGKDLFVSVNLSGKHFGHPDLVRHVQDVLEKTGFDPTKLKLEITETALMENAGTSVEMLRSLRELGVQISLDDFGTGYSSLNYLHRFPIDTLKIDRSFVNSLERSSENSEIVRTIVYLAKALGLSVVAEGIESIRQLSQLQGLGCDFGQGYLFSRPLPAAEMEILLIEDFHWRGLLRESERGTVYPDMSGTSDARLIG